MTIELKNKSAAFSLEFMRKTIGFGQPLFAGSEFIGFHACLDPQNLSCGVWYGFVPEKFKKIAMMALRSASSKIIGEQATRATIELFIAELHSNIQWLFDRIEIGEK